jgi:hypothetical protein
MGTNETVTTELPTVETTPVVETQVIAPTADAPSVDAKQSTAIELNGRDIYTISFVESGIPYKNGKRSEKGKTFTRYTRNNIAFAIPDEHPFNADFANGQVKSVILTEGKSEVKRVDDEGNETLVNIDTLNFASYINKMQWSTLRDEELEDAKAEFTIARFKKLKTENVSADFLTALMAGSVQQQ